ncbi:MAG: hypothetical protein DWP95_12480 [Proteobacteria bacterium]|nr:MAG: hypothetical protein DWP95_12480 [Pseudomonadota bacterium]
MNHLKTALVVLLLQFSVSLHAAEFCVTTATELYNALTVAESNASHDIIKIAEGSYVTNGVPFNYDENLGWDLDISGGWTDHSGNPCGQQLGNNPYGTILDGNSNSGVLLIGLSGDTNLRVANLYFTNGYDAASIGAGLYIYHGSNPIMGTIVIENNIFINNETEYASALYSYGGDKTIVRNNLFFANHALEANSVMIFQRGGYGVYFTNNTVAFNTAAISLTLKAGAFISVNSPSQGLVANNVFWGNGHEDLALFGSGDIYLKNNNLGTMAEGSNYNTPLESRDNFSLPPRFDAGSLNFTPSAISPLVNAGVKPCFFCPIPIPFDESWSLGATDLAGNLRTQSSKVDIGAFESSHDRDLIFWGIFE